MSNDINSERDPGQPLVYQIRIKGHLGRQWTDWIGGLTSTLEGNGPATATSSLASELLFRVSIVSDLVGAVAFILLAITLYRLFSGVNKTHGSLLVAFILVASAIMFLIVLNEIASLALFHGAG